MSKKLFASLLLLMALTMPSLGQTIPDSVSQRLILLGIVNQPSQVQQDANVNNMGVSDSNDVTIVESAATDFNSQYQALIVNYQTGLNMTYPQFAAQRDALVANAVSTIDTQTSLASSAAFDAYVQSEKANMAYATDGSTYDTGYDHTQVNLSPDFGEGGPDPVTDGGGDDDETVDGAGPPACELTETSSYTFYGPNTWSSFNFSLAPGASLVDITSGTDGAVIALDSNAIPYAYNYATNSWSALPGSVKQIRMKDFTTIFGIGLDNKVYQFSEANNAWALFSSTPVTQIAPAADYQTNGMWAANGTNMYYWSPTTHAFSTYHTFASNILSIDSAGAGTAFVLTADGNAWLTDGPNNALNNFSNFNTLGIGTVVQFVVATTDDIFFLRTSTGAIYRYFGGLTLFSGQTGVALAADSQFNVYAATPGGAVERYLATGTENFSASQRGSGQLFALNAVSNEPAGQQTSVWTKIKVTMQCVGGVVVTLLTEDFGYKSEEAYTAVKNNGIIESYQCTYGGVPTICGTWNVLANCDVVHTPPDFNPTKVTLDKLEPPAWGWATWAKCYSLTGHQPFICATGDILSKSTVYMPPAQCTHNP